MRARPRPSAASVASAALAAFAVLAVQLAGPVASAHADTLARAVPDAGTRAVPDAGTRAVPDAGTRVAPDAASRAAPVTVTRVVHPGETLEAALLAPWRPNRAQRRALPGPGREALLGRVATRTLLPGRAVGADAVRAPDAVRAGEPVTLRLAIGALLIEARAVALEGAARGDPVRLRNLATGRVVTGLVTGPGEAIAP